MFGQQINKKKAGTKGAPRNVLRNYQAAKNLRNVKKYYEVFKFCINILNKIYGNKY